MKIRSKFIASALAIMVAIALVCILLSDRYQSLAKEDQEAQGTQIDIANSGEIQHEVSSKKRVRHRSQVPDQYLAGLSPDEIETLANAMSEYNEYLEDLEFRHSVLRWEVDRDDRKMRLYELQPPSDDELANANTGIDRIMAGLAMRGGPRKAFARWAPEQLKAFLVPQGQNGSVVFIVPKSDDKHVIVSRCVGNVEINRLVMELEASKGDNATGLGGGASKVMLLNNIEARSRYSRFMVTGSVP